MMNYIVLPLQFKSRQGLIQKIDLAALKTDGGLGELWAPQGLQDRALVGEGGKTPLNV